MAHPYLARRPPKSTGRESFGPALIEGLLRRAAARHIAEEDLVATATAFTADSVVLHIRRDLPDNTAALELITCGGGGRNLTLLKQLQDALPECRFLTADEAGFPGRAIEASAFALLAYLTATGLPGNLPGVTGAARPVILGKILPGRRYRGVL